jgi:hypothetical protein
MRRTSFPQNSHRKVLNGDRFAIVAFVASVTIALAALFITLPRPVVLPAFSICALAAAACLALMASLQLRQAGRLLPSAWNLAGAYACRLRCSHTRRSRGHRRIYAVYPAEEQSG